MSFIELRSIVFDIVYTREAISYRNMSAVRFAYFMLPFLISLSARSKWTENRYE